MKLYDYFFKRKKNRSSTQNALRFFVQRHDATHLHYDFRLEHKGKLLSWAIPKGPSLNPKDKRLAIRVEDHTLSYGDFSGTIPKGHYGAGSVSLWDQGTFTIKGSSNQKEADKIIASDLKKGHLEFILQGNILKGSFNLIHLKNNAKKNLWLLIKINDEFAIDSPFNTSDTIS